MREMLKLGIFLLVVGALAGLGVSYVNEMTEPVIEVQAKNAELSALEEVYPGADKIVNESDKYIDADTDSAITQVNVAYTGDQPAGVIYKVEPAGYGGPITEMVGFDIAKQEVTNIKILEQKETPGLGARCQEPSFTDRFKGKKIADPLEVIKQGTPGDSEIVAITASTITSKAVTSGVNIARSHFVEHFGQ